MNLRFLPVACLVLAACGIAALGARLVSSERKNVEREQLAELEADAARSARRVSDFVAGSLNDVRAARITPVVRVVAGRFEIPCEPSAATTLAVIPGRDPEGEFLLLEAETLERSGALERAKGALAAAGDGARDATIRAIAATRLAAIARAAGDQAEAIEAGRAALAAMDISARDTSREALLLRHLDAKDDPTLVASLTKLVGSADDAFARALLVSTESGRAALEDRDRALARRAHFESLRLRPEAAGEAAALSDGRLWLAIRDDHDVVEGFETIAPELPPNQRFVRSSEPIVQGSFAARAPIGLLLPDVAVEAALEGEVVAAAVARRGAWIAAMLFSVIASIVGAVFVWNRGARREREHAKARSDFVARVGHDLRTPLTLIRMYGETLAADRAGTSERRTEFAGIVVRESERLTRLVSTVLDFARLEGGAVAGMRESVDLRTLAREVSEAHRPLLESVGMTLSIETGETPLPARVDADAVRGALGNLIENVVHHAASSESITIACRKQDGNAEISVADRGPGVPEGERMRIFGRFARGAGVTSKGTGLGLALVREVALAHGGDAFARNREGGGLVSVLCLPLQTPSENGVSRR